MIEVETKPPPRRFQHAKTAFRSVAVHVQDTQHGRIRLAVAVALARGLDARLVGVGAEAIDPWAIGNPYGLGVEMVAEMEGTVRGDLERAGNIFKAAVSGLTTEWRSGEEEPLHALLRAARGADLIVASGRAGGPGDVYHGCPPGELVLKAGKPVLFTPTEGGRELKAERIVVAWKDTREGRRALADAMPFLRDAAEVVVAQICAKGGYEEALAAVSEIAERLKREGVAARALARTAPAELAAAELQSTAAAVGADLLVCGGYGHTRLGEWLFGGVTQSLLDGPRQFILMSH